MKKIIIVLSIFFFNITAFGQGSNEAKSLLDEVAKKVEEYNNIYLEFDHKLDNNDADVHQETMGKVTLKGDLYHLNYMGTEQIFDGKKTYLIIHEDEEVIIQNSVDNEAETLTPSKMFSFYKTGFTYEMDALKSIKGIKIQYVKLIPIDSNSEITNILIGIDIKTKHIYNIIETGENNTITTLEIRTFKTNQPISEKLFIFDKAKFRDQMNYTISEPN
ncbi:outer membrane lipoprotein-sorting protein [Lutibacter oceani]|uniref:Outer membrane lipoprotein-sorting protein n=1 Tax=Lutibacter oceani TaxID=1853311 RepID=A0A3D9RT20_9FLAO|nr:outer membrane lipoprotein carrier protein LolA [Lutibacter oceani]REE79845.1 outer membrane lipoprotein-sorting protein [Lutibacter oceani]